MVDQKALGQIINFAKIKPEPLVVEIGPGRGHLTKHLLASPAKAILALEIDQDLTANLRDSFKQEVETGRLKVLLADCRQYDWSSLKNYFVFGNIPYYLTAYLLRKLLAAENRAETICLLVAKEVAQKLAASQNRSQLATIVQFHYQPFLGPTVLASSFRPPPKIDSQVIRLEKSGPEEPQWPIILNLLKFGYCQPRRYLINNLASNYNKKELQDVFLKLDFSQKNSPGRPH